MSESEAPEISHGLHLAMLKRFWIWLCAVGVLILGTASIFGYLAYSHIVALAKDQVSGIVKEQLESNNKPAERFILSRFEGLQAAIDERIGDLTRTDEQAKAKINNVDKALAEASARLSQIRAISTQAETELNLIQQASGQDSIKKIVEEIIRNTAASSYYEATIAGLRGVIVAIKGDACPRGWDKFEAGQGRFIVGAGPTTSDLPTQSVNDTGGSFKANLSSLNHKHWIGFGMEEGGTPEGKGGYVNVIGDNRVAGTADTRGWDVVTNRLGPPQQTPKFESEIAPPFVALTWCQAQGFPQQ